MNSFIGWVGGKRALRKEIIGRFPKEFDRYIEVFGGAGWVLFGKEQKTGQLEVYNDISGDLVNLFRCIKYHCQELQRELEWLLSSREQFICYSDQLKSNGLTDIQRASRFLIIIKTSFGSKLDTFKTGTTNIQNVSQYLSKVRNRLTSVVIENQDFQRLINIYDRPEALFYLDPPYFGAESYYRCNFDESQHRRLAGVLKTIKGCFILSYNDSEFIRELYNGYRIEGISRRMELASKPKSNQYKELIISNF